MEILLKIFDLVGSILPSLFQRFSDEKLNRRVLQRLKEMLDDEDHSLRRFDTLLHAVAVYDDEPKKLREALIMAGARRYKNTKNEELWGFPHRNKSAPSLERYPFAKMGAVVSAVGVVGVTVATFLNLSGFEPDIAADKTEPTLDYLCMEDGSEVSPGRCFPAKNQTSIPRDVRIALYIHCRVTSNGVDQYTSNCCDHLTQNDGLQLAVCNGREALPSGLEAAIVLSNFASIEDLIAEYAR
ncbi:hypothetical protein [uncultured Roseobacter sp.]|uniref:hypothetical protein n=1 Tax=uncultured Roseobacter sp. TaxID=114847 RepID=UPI0026077905|nr:hypothetical protein [uncultured Roseobacter sp.]